MKSALIAAQKNMKSAYFKRQEQSYFDNDLNPNFMVKSKQVTEQSVAGVCYCTTPPILPLLLPQV